MAPLRPWVVRALSGSYHCGRIAHQTVGCYKMARTTEGTMFVQSFGSGSCGNALLVEHGDASLLVDCGLSPRNLGKALSTRGTRLERLDAILLTHEHDDHVRGLAAARNHRVPLIASEGTALALGLPRSLVQHVLFHEPIVCAGLEIQAIATSHDAAQPCGYSISDGTARVTLLTDLGKTSDACAELMAGSQLIVIEANHDLQMLKSGPYPEHLKRRVLSALGHLSNDDCGAYLVRCLGAGSSSRTIWLAHLSATNNRPSLAVRAVQQKLVSSRFPHRISALPRREIGPTWQPMGLTSVAQLGLFD